MENLLFLGVPILKHIRVVWYLYTESCGDNAVLYCSQCPGEDLQPILREEVDTAL